jgi:hypothetical protein
LRVDEAFHGQRRIAVGSTSSIYEIYEVTLHTPRTDKLKTDIPQKETHLKEGNKYRKAQGIPTFEDIMEISPAH